MGIKILTLETSCYWPSLKRLETIIFSWTTVLIVIFERSLNEKAPLRKFMHKFFIFFFRVHEPALKLFLIAQGFPGQIEPFWPGRHPALFPLVSYRRPGNLDFLNCNKPDGPSIAQKFQTSFFSKINPYPEIWSKIQKQIIGLVQSFSQWFNQRKKELV